MISAEPLQKTFTSAALQTPLPLVQVGIPVYNGEKDIRVTIERLLQQDYQNLEIIISDNASTDSTGEICQSLAKQHANIVYWRNSENIGSLANLDSVFLKSTGKYFVWCGHNDSFSPGFISKAVEIMESDPRVALCFPRGELEWEDGREKLEPVCFIDTRNLSREAAFLSIAWHAGQCTEFYGAYRRTALEQAVPIKRFLLLDCIHLIHIAALGSFAYIPSERITIKVRKTNLITTAQRHGITVHETFGREQYMLVCKYFIGIAFKHFSVTSFLLMLPSILLCLAEKYIWFYRATNSHYKLEMEKNACK